MQHSSPDSQPHQASGRQPSAAAPILPEAPHHDSSAGRRTLSAQSYQALADVMPQLVWMTDANGAHVYYNQRWYAYTGLSEADSLGFGFTNALHPDDIERTLQRWQAAWRDGASYEVEYRFRRYDGVYHWFIGRAQPVAGPDGTIVEWVGTCTDIDEQKHTNETLQFIAEASTLLAGSLEYETTLAQVAQLAVPHIADWCAVDLLDPDGTLRRLAVAHIDPAKVALAHELQRRLPYDPDAPGGVAQVIRTSQPELVSTITDEMVRQSGLEPDLRDIFLALGLRSSMIVPLCARNQMLGTITLVSAESGRQFTEADLQLAEELARRAAIAIDNARLYRELHQFRTTLDQTYDCVFMFEPETLRYFYANQGAIAQVGYSQAELLQMTPVDIQPEYSVERFRAMLAPLLSDERALHTYETLHRHKDGHTIPVEVALQCVAPDDAPGRFVAVVRDITAHKQAEAALRASEQRYRTRSDELERMAQQLEERNRELDQFAYITSHDLKAPLRGIANLSQWIEEDLGETVPEEVQSHLELLRGRVYRMEALIDGILTYSRVGRTREAIEPVDVRPLLEDVIDLLAPDEHVAITIGPDMPTLQTTRLPLQQVFANLIGNAIKHHGGEQIQVTVTAQPRDGMVEFAVADNGPGIAPQYHERIFGIFQTLASRDRVEGSGLGLALVKKIVEHQRGRIWLSSAEGQGAVFHFTWPAEAAES